LRVDEASQLGRDVLRELKGKVEEQIAQAKERVQGGVEGRI